MNHMTGRTNREENPETNNRSGLLFLLISIEPASQEAAECS